MFVGYVGKFKFKDQNVVTLGYTKFNNLITIVRVL